MATVEDVDPSSKLPPELQKSIEEIVDRRVMKITRATTLNKLLRRITVGSDSRGLIAETLAAVTSKTGNTPEDAISIALTLYDVAIDAAKQGQRLLLVDEDYRFIREVTGLTRNVSEQASTEMIAG